MHKVRGTAWATGRQTERTSEPEKAGEFEPQKFEGHSEEALTELINQSGHGKTIAHKPRQANVVDLMEALKQSISADHAPKQKKQRKASSRQKEMLMSVSGGGKPAKKAAKKSVKSDRRSA